MHDGLTDEELVGLFELIPLEGGLVEPVTPRGKKRMRAVQFRLVKPKQRRDSLPVVFNTNDNGNVGASDRQIVGGHPQRVARIEELQAAYASDSFEVDYNPVKLGVWLLKINPHIFD